MTYNEKIPEFALQPAKSEKIEQEQIDDGFDPTPYDRLLAKQPKDQEETIKVREILKKNEEDRLEESEAAEPTVEAEETLDTMEIEEEEASIDTVEAPVSHSEAEIVPQPNTVQLIQPKEPEIPMPAAPIKITPMSNMAVYSDLKLTSVVQEASTKIYVEEDILVPDIKPDLISILSMDGKAILSGKELQMGNEENLRMTGEVALQTVYLPEEKEGGEPIAIIQSRLPFKTDWAVSASPMSHLSITPEIDKIDYTVVNERKFRAKITLRLVMKEYAEKDMQIFENMNGENLQLLKEKVQLSHITLRKEDSVDISEILSVKEGSLKPDKLLKYDINIVENHKQVTSEKVVINASICCNIMYMGHGEEESEEYRQPALLQTKTDFTQFILIDKRENIVANQVTFNGNELTLSIKEEEEGSVFVLGGNVRTQIELYENIEKEIVSDLYHNVNDTTYDLNEKTAHAIIGGGNTEISTREIFNIPEKNGQVAKVIYINGTIKESTATVEQGRCLVEGIMEGQILCLGEEDNRPFNLTQEMNFRGSMEIPTASEHMTANTKIAVKDLWFDKINGKQVEVNATLQVESTVIENRPLKLIKNPCFVESEQISRPTSMVIYITKRGDTLWDIAKKYKIGRENIAGTNNLDENQKITEGMRLLIVK